jgi:ribosome-binding protein aMBF1 (putative translation factor)
MTLSESVKSAIQTCGLSVYRLSQKVQVEESALRRFITGKAGLSMAALDRTAAYLGVTVSTPKKDAE